MRVKRVRGSCTAYIKTGQHSATLAKNTSAAALSDDQRQLLEDSTGPDGVIHGKLQGLIFTRWRVRQHPAEILLLQYARVGCLVLVGQNYTPEETESAVTKGPHSSAL